MEEREGRSLSETPTWAVATVVTVMVASGFFINGSLKHFGKWLDRTKRKSLLAALDKIKEEPCYHILIKFDVLAFFVKAELMLFGLLSLLMGHWIIFVAKICIKSSALSTRFYPCTLESEMDEPMSRSHISVSNSYYLNYSVSKGQANHVQNDYCPKGRDSFASHESLEQLHRFLFVLGITHVSYSFMTIALAMIKIYSWRKWENQAKTMVIQGLQSSSEAASRTSRMSRLSTFIFHHTSHPWNQNKVLVWMLCFSRQFWSSINRADYMALRLGFITVSFFCLFFSDLHFPAHSQTHQLPFSYDFHNYMLRSMEEEFRDIVGIRNKHLLLDFLRTSPREYASFVVNVILISEGHTAYLILLVGTKLHRIVVKLAFEIMDASQWIGNHQFKLRDELFWFNKPRLLLRLIQFISFQNAFEMATFIWSLWEIKQPSCFTKNTRFLVTRLTFGIVAQFWCSFITFPLYVIVTQMGSKFKKSIISEDVRRSLHGWRRRVKTRHGGKTLMLPTAISTASLDSMVDEIETIDIVAPSSLGGCSSIYEDTTIARLQASMEQGQTNEITQDDDELQDPLCRGPSYDTSDDNCDDEHNNDVAKDNSLFLPLA
ncbi:hypothetical protein RJ639_016345 [Escallonia herrerae]|uniref:MLO-like protein n=1 Tax=Escallonia herrerae TaxID=1293975 RepID=A0AA89AK20_9ASTE|nr:hypothetical protein RJ639_016345 [Escallonia herrerae]